MWRQRLDGSGLWVETWLRHQRRDALWKHGSVCEDFGAIKCAVYAVGGWADGYTNAIPRLMAGLKSPRKALIGQWAHRFPHMALPGPAVGFLQDSLRASSERPRVALAGPSAARYTPPTLPKFQPRAIGGSAQALTASGSAALPREQVG